ncbi:DUF4352 domain-containing protein [Desulfolucanica intricata]|uniref:DUF4352 domain-containing protein n=1 Tax=Desulfolucanica intricata TaxID=1285191 RepID=UPI00083602D3|nr:DUF4352 domain-containing protein [Desulfolucanica intricata]
MNKSVKVFIFLLLTLALLAAGCGETTAPEKVNSATGETTVASGSAEVKTPEVFSVGESVKMGDLQFTVNSVRNSNGNNFIKPKEGNVYLLADCTIDNLSQEATSISSILMFKVVDNEGYNYNVTIGPDTRGTLDGELAPGRKMRGELVFEVPVQAQSLELIFEPNLFGFGQAIYKIK